MVLFRYFYIKHNNYILTNEIELYDVNNNNVALNKTVTSSSVYSNIYLPSKAVDGINSSDNYFHSLNSSDEWIEIDLGQEFDIRKVRIYNEYTPWNTTAQHVISGALLIGCNDKAGRTDTTKMLWSTTFASIPAGSDITSPRYWDYIVIPPPTITFNDINKTFGQASFDLSPSSNSSGAFSYTSSNAAVATVSGSTVTIVGGGSTTITATQAATTNYSQGTATATLTVSQAVPTITFSNIDKTFGDASFNLIDPSSNSSGSFSYTSSDAAVATVSGSTVTIVGGGTCTINATQAATTNYLQGTATSTLRVSQAVPTITFSNIDKTFGDASFNLSPSSNSDGAFSYTSSDAAVATVSGSTVTIVGAGSATINATQAATTNYLQGTATSTLRVSQATPTITFSNIDKTFGDASFNLIDPSSNSSGSFSYTSSNTAVASVSGSTVTIVGAGTCTITATQAASGNYSQGTATSTLSVSQATPTIVFNNIIKTVGAQPFNLAPISNSDGVFSYTSSNTTVATIQSIVSAQSLTFSNYSTSSTNQSSMSLAVSDDGNTRVIAHLYNSSISYSKYNGTSWSSYVTINNSESLGNYRGCCLTSGGLRGIVTSTGGYCYFFTWNGSAYTSITRTLDTNIRNYYDVGVTSDGSRIVTVAGGQVYFATWNGSNYNAFISTGLTLSPSQGVCITSDGSKIAYCTDGNSVYWASWNGTTYVVGSNISNAVYSGRRLKFSIDGNILFYAAYGNTSCTVQYSMWNGTGYSSFNLVPTSAIPASLDPWGFAVDSNSIYVISWPQTTMYKTTITNIANLSFNSTPKVNIVGAGTSTITATQAATTNYLQGTATSTLTVNKIVTLLTGLTNIVKSFGDIFTLNYVSNSNGSLSYSISDPSIATIFGSEVTATKVGSTTITVTQAETDNYLSETLSFVLTVNKAEPLPSNFNNITKTFGDASFNIVAPTSLSSAGFTYISSNISVAVVSGSTITIVGAGSTTIIATQATNDEYLSGSISCVLTVNKASPLLNNFLNVVKTYGNAPFNIIAPTSLSTGSLTYSSSNTSIATVTENIVTIVSTGIVAIIATQEETNNYLSETIYYTLTINKIDTSLNDFENIIKTYGDSDFSLEEPLSDRPGTYVYTSSDESVATISGSTVTIHSGGFISITAIQQETEIYKPGFITCSLKVNRINSTLNYIDVLQVGATYKLKVETNSDGLFSYNVSDSTAVTINSDNTLSFLKPCDVVIIATQAETATYYSGKFSTVVSYLGA
jgi:hypothetical protein